MDEFSLRDFSLIHGTSGSGAPVKEKTAARSGEELRCKSNEELYFYKCKSEQHSLGRFGILRIQTNLYPCYLNQSWSQNSTLFEGSVW
jgi:hypothetical protein